MTPTRPADRAAEARLDAWLATSTPPAPPPALRAAILAATAQPSHARLNWRQALTGLWQDIGGARLAGPAFALALIAGIGLGTGLTSQAGVDDAADDLLALALIEDDYLALAP